MLSMRFAPLLAVALLAAAPSAQPLPVDVHIDHGSFRYDESSTLLEVYLSVGLASLDYEFAEGEGYVSELPVRVDIHGAGNVLQDAEAAPAAPVFSRDLDLRFVVPDTASLSASQVYFEQVRAALPPGDYAIVATLVGGEGRPELSLRRDATVPAYSGATVSSVQIATSISRADEADAFTKSGLRIQPNPSAVYLPGMKSVPYYAELYGVDAAVEGGPYTLLTFLSTSNQQAPLPDFQQRTERPSRPVDIAVGRFDVSELASGTYYLRVVALNEANEPVAERSKKIYVINPDVASETVYSAGEDYESTLFGVMEAEELDMNLEHALIIATGRERDAARRLETDEAKRNFLATFWRGRDADPNPNVNSARRTFYERLDLVNDRFREPLTDGYKTERGRVFLTYGPPSEIDNRRFEAEAVPYVIWHYESIPGEGRSVFVFADRYSSGRMELIHSDVNGEVSLPSWENELIRIR